MKNIVICDLDGTLTDVEHRRHLVDGSQKRDWDRFYDLCDMDRPHDDVARLIWTLANTGLRIVYVTGRVERVRGKTIAWLRRFGMPEGELHMRADGDHRQDNILKAEIAERENLTPTDVFMVFDDRDQVVQMWRERGFRCLQVANGNF